MHTAGLLGVEPRRPVWRSAAAPRRRWCMHSDISYTAPSFAACWSGRSPRHRLLQSETGREGQVTMDIDGLSEAELIALNHRIVERLPLPQQMRAHKQMLEF